MKVVFLPKIQIYFKELAIILYEKGYFIFEDTAHRYVDELFNDIEMNLHLRFHSPAPSFFDKYGKDMEYAVFKKSKHTHWYIFFRVYKKGEEEIYQVRYIANNHVIAQYL